VPAVTSPDPIPADPAVVYPTAPDFSAAAAGDVDGKVDVDEELTKTTVITAVDDAVGKADEVTAKTKVKVTEVCVVCIDVSGSMETPFECDGDARTVDRTRLEAVKQVIHARSRARAIAGRHAR
jgi:hypothetical protein